MSPANHGKVFGAGLEVRLRSVCPLLTALRSDRLVLAMPFGLVEEENEALRRAGEEEDEMEASEFSDFFSAFQLLPAPADVETAVADRFMIVLSEDDDDDAKRFFLLRSEADVCAVSNGTRFVAVCLAMRP